MSSDTVSLISFEREIKSSDNDICVFAPYCVEHKQIFCNLPSERDDLNSSYSYVMQKLALF